MLHSLTIKKGVEMLVNALKWRVQLKVDELLLKGESEVDIVERTAGKGFLYKTDVNNRPIVWIQVKLHNKNESDIEAVKKLSTLTFEAGRLLLPKGVENIAIVFDMTGFSLACMDYDYTVCHAF
jgi:hypothetical protein